MLNKIKVYTSTGKLIVVTGYSVKGDDALIDKYRDKIKELQKVLRGDRK